MKIYIAASYPRKEEAKFLADTLTNRHNEIVSGWILRDEGYISDDRIESKAQKFDRMQSAAIMDAKDIKECDILICFTDGREQLTYGGRHTELGMAMALEKYVAIIGERESVFHYFPGVKVFRGISEKLFDWIANVAS